MEITGIVSLKLSLFLLKMKRTIQLLGDSHSSILLPYALSLSSPKHNSSITFQIPPRMALYIFSFLEHSLTFFQRFPTLSRFSNPLAIHGISLHSVPDLWQCVASLSITFLISGNRGISFHNVFGLWQCFITFPALSGNVTPRFRSLAVLHNVSSSLWQCYTTFLSGNVT
jgi:hypothetical protein